MIMARSSRSAQTIFIDFLTGLIALDEQEKKEENKSLAHWSMNIHLPRYFS